MGIKVNVSGKEASSQILTPIPAGWYKLTISDCDLKQVTNAPQPGKKDNRGEAYYALEFTVAEGEYEGRKVYSNAMLFAGALYTIVQLMKGLGMEVNEGELEIPEPEDLLGGQVWALVKVQGERKVGDKTYDARNDIKGFRAKDEGDPDTTTQAAAKTTSLLPS